MQQLQHFAACLFDYVLVFVGEDPQDLVDYIGVMVVSCLGFLVTPKVSYREWLLA